MRTSLAFLAIFLTLFLSFSSFSLGSQSAAVVEITLNSAVGILLDDVPSGPQRDIFANHVLSQSTEFWESLALLQASFTRKTAMISIPHLRGLESKPILHLNTLQRGSFDDHDYVYLTYTFNSTVVGTSDSLATLEPSLADVGGMYDETMMLPVDPTSFFRRTGMSCVDQRLLPENSIDNFNVANFFDPSCMPENYCSFGRDLALTSCEQALRDTVGAYEAGIEYEHLDQDFEDFSDLVSPISSEPDVAVLVHDSSDDYSVEYKYIAEDSCEFVSHCVHSHGWRRLLKYGATFYNAGAGTLNLGRIIDPTNYETHLYDVNSCSGDLPHYSLFAETSFNTSTQGMVSQSYFNAFGLVGGRKFLNSPSASFVRESVHADDQSLQFGWAFDFHAGTTCQWLDITRVNPQVNQTQTISIDFNTYDYVCEGEPSLHANGSFVFEDVDTVKNNEGNWVERPACDFSNNPDFDTNNLVEAVVNTGSRKSTVSSACRITELGPNRDCGLVEQPQYPLCTQNKSVKMACKVNPLFASIPVPRSSTYMVRICDYSETLKGGVDCKFEDALTHEMIAAGNPDSIFEFACPTNLDRKDKNSFFSHFSMYFGTLGDTNGYVSCTCIENCAQEVSRSDFTHFSELESHSESAASSYSSTISFFLIFAVFFFAIF